MRFLKGISVLFFVLAILACENKCLRPTKVIAVEPYHATRVWIIYKDSDEKYRKESLFQADTINVCGAIIYADDYLCGRKPYGPIDGQKKEYQKYLGQKK